MAAIIGPIRGEISMLEARKIVLFSTSPKLARTLKWIVDMTGLRYDRWIVKCWISKNARTQFLNKYCTSFQVISKVGEPDY